jgi:hypothetical protein
MSDDALPHATISEQDGIITVMVDRPRKLNAYSRQVTATFWEAANALADRDDLRCMVIAATGKYFTAGMDLAAGSADRPGDPETMDQHPGWNFRRNYRSHHLLYDEFEAIEKPIVLAIQGICLGAGVEIEVHGRAGKPLRRTVSHVGIAVDILVQRAADEDVRRRRDGHVAAELGGVAVRVEADRRHGLAR